MPIISREKPNSVELADYRSWAFSIPAATIWATEPLQITVASAREVRGKVRAVVRAGSPPEVQIHLQLLFPIKQGIDIWAAARDEMLRYLDVS